MKICGLITEYNPFHNGHVYHIEEAKKITGCDKVIVFMSGHFVQSGNPAIIDPYSRTQMALDSGADAVFMMPVLFSTSTAEVFATAAVSFLEQSGVIDSLVFGSEIGEIEPLQKIAAILNHEPVSFKKDLKGLLKTGKSYPVAREEALLNYCSDSIENLSTILRGPNNILAIEYLRALDTIGSAIKPYTIRRDTAAYKSEVPSKNFASATALRKMLLAEDGLDDILPYVPASTYREFALHIGQTAPICADDFSLLLQYVLMQQKNTLEKYLDFTVDLSKRVQNLLPGIYSFTEWTGALKTKGYTETRIRRALLHAILQITGEDLASYKEEEYCMYARLLGFQRESENILRLMKRHSNLPIITKMADAKKKLSEKAYRLLSMDIEASNLYRNVIYQKYGCLPKDDFTIGIIKK